MDENPYQPPQSETPRTKSIPWGHLCLGGLAVMLVSAIALCSMGEFRHGGVIFLHASLAILLAALFCVGGVLTLGSGIGWLISVSRPRKG